MEGVVDVLVEGVMEGVMEGLVEDVIKDVVEGVVALSLILSYHLERVATPVLISDKDTNNIISPSTFFCLL